MTDKDEKPPENEPPVKPSNEQITDSLFSALTADESLTEDDRRSIAEGLTQKTGGTVPEPVKPKTDHWSERKLW